MFDSLLAQAALHVQEHLPLAALCAFAWGLVCVVFSPCHLAAIPVMAAHAAGYTRSHHHRDENAENPRDNSRAASRANLGFALGYFLAIAGLGVGCAILGRMVGGVDEHVWMIPAGALLLWFGVALWREHSCSVTGSWGPWLQTLGHRLGLGPGGGGTVLGLAYGLLSGGCTLAFLAPVVMLSLPQGLMVGSVMATAFALGHCLPMALVGAAAPVARRFMQACRLPGGHAGMPHPSGHDTAAPHPGGSAPHARTAHSGHEHHKIEQIFRKVVAVGVCAGGVALLLHGLWE